jgi:hypothetical protein
MTDEECVNSLVRATEAAFKRHEAQGQAVATIAACEFLTGAAQTARFLVLCGEVGTPGDPWTREEHATAGAVPERMKNTMRIAHSVFVAQCKESLAKCVRCWGRTGPFLPSARVFLGIPHE